MSADGGGADKPAAESFLMALSRATQNPGKGWLMGSRAQQEQLQHFLTVETLVYTNAE